MPVLEIIVFLATDAYKKDTSVLNDALVQLSSVAGVQSSYCGFQVENPANGIWAVVWDTYEASHAFSKSTEHTGFLAKCDVAVAEKPELILHVKVTADLIKPISAPVTEFAFITLKPGKKMDDLVALIRPLEQEINIAKGAHDSSWGPSVQKDDLYVGTIGWDDVDAHWTAVAEGTPCHKIITEIREIADISLKHVALRKFTT